MTGGNVLHATLGIGLAPSAEGAGRHTGRRRKRYILPDGQVLTDPTEAYAEFERQVRVRAAELDLGRTPAPVPTRQRKRKRSRLIHPKTPPKPLAARPLPVIIERLPEAERAKIDYELIELALRVAKRRRDEEALVLLM